MIKELLFWILCLILLYSAYEIGKIYSYDYQPYNTPLSEIEQCRGKTKKSISNYSCYETKEGLIILKKIK